MAKKYDKMKPPLSLVDPQFTEEMSYVLSGGEDKYGRMNWATGKPFNFERLINAAERHLSAFKGGENEDLESGFSHLIHAACNLMFLNYYLTRGIGNDDRRYKRYETMPNLQTTELDSKFLSKQNQEERLDLQHLQESGPCEYPERDPIQKLQDRITIWADQVFPGRTAEGALCKLVLEEIPELLNRGLDDPGEYADVLILILDVAKLRGIDAVKAAHDKMTINEKRQWAINPKTGLMHHIEEE